MEIILQNLPESKEEIYLLFQSSVLKTNNSIIYNNDSKDISNLNEIIISQNKYKFDSIHKDIDKDLLTQIITKSISSKKDISILFMLNLNKDNNDNNYNDNDIMFGIRNIFNKFFFDKNNIKLIEYNYNEININDNKNENIIIDKIIKKDSDSFSIDIPEKNNTNIFFLKIKIVYEDINISSYIKIYFLYNSFEKIIPLFSKNKKEKEILILNEKIDNLMLIENNIKQKLNNLTFINNDYIQNVNIYKEEVMNYFDKFIKKIEVENKENIPKNRYNNKNNLNELIKEGKKLMESLTREEFKNKEKNIYQQYIKVYSDINKNFEKLNNNDIFDLKIFINKFNNLNEELLNLLENNKNNKKEIFNKNKENEEILSLKNKIFQLEKEFKKEKNKNNTMNTNISQKEPKLKQRSISAVKIPNNNNKINQQKLEEENKKLKKIIEELKETISKLKSKKEFSLKSPDKNHPSLINETGKNNTSLNIIINSPKKSTNQMQSEYNTTNKKQKTLNKTKTNTDILINGNSLLLLKKIQQENKELSKQLKDFSTKNTQLELSLKGIAGGDINIKNHSSLLNSFTKNTRGELKNIEKKYGLNKNK